MSSRKGKTRNLLFTCFKYDSLVVRFFIQTDQPKQLRYVKVAEVKKKLFRQGENGEVAYRLSTEELSKRCVRTQLRPGYGQMLLNFVRASSAYSAVTFLFSPCKFLWGVYSEVVLKTVTKAWDLMKLLSR